MRSMYNPQVRCSRCAMIRLSALLLALGASPVHGEPAVDLAVLDVDVEAEQLACHGPPREPRLGYEAACAQAEAARLSGDSMSLIQAVEDMRMHDPGESRTCTTRYDDAIAGIHRRNREDYRAGLAAMKAGELERARACFRVSLSKDPYNQVCARRLGEVEAALARQAAEAEETTQAPEADPGS